MRSILFCICTFITCAALAQEPDTTYQLLWYKGKKIRTNVLLTPKLDTVFYQPSKGLVKVVSKTGSGKRLDNIMIELARTPQRMNQMMQKLSGALPKPLAPYYAIHVKNAYTQVQEDLTEAISNTIVLPGIEPVQAGVPQSTAFKAQTAQPAKDKHPFDGLTVADVKNLPLVKEILEYHEKVKNETITWVPTPPRNDLTYCLSCDSTKEKQFDHDFKVFRKEFFGSDEPIFIKILAVMREAELLMNKEERDEVRRLLNPVFEHIMARLTSKAMLLAEKYADDPYRGRAVAMMVLSIERQRQLLGLHDGGDVLGGVFMRTQEALKNLVDKAISEYDYTIALDVRLILATERQFQLLGGKGFDLDRVLGFNQFKMKLDISGKVEGD
ncbi:MAG TPA: hypothetical protein VD996_08740, partial [Chitinophagaceae bacterium]|nr:hypothetical protein [Chitinophagaceae bacterium]